MLTDPEKNIKQEKKINQTKIYKFKITSSGNNDKSKFFQISQKFTSSEKITSTNISRLSINSQAMRKNY